MISLVWPTGKRRWLAVCALFASLITVAAAAAAGPRPLIFGVFPNLTPKLLIETYRPLADALQAGLRRPVEIYTAPNFERFADARRAGEFDLILTAPHLAWLAQRESGYRPILKYARAVRGIVVVRNDSPVRRVSQLAGLRIATAYPLAITVMAMKQALADADVDPRSYVAIDAETHNNAATQVADGAADAAILGEQPFRQLPSGLRGRLRIVAASPPLSGQVFLTHPRVSDNEANAIRQTLLRWAASPHGLAFLARGGFGGLVQPDGRELQTFKRYAAETQKLLHGH